MRQHRADLSAKGVPLRAFHTASGNINIRLASRLPSSRCPLRSNDVIKSNREVFLLPYIQSIRNKHLQSATSTCNPQQAPAIHNKHLQSIKKEPDYTPALPTCPPHAPTSANLSTKMYRWRFTFQWKHRHQTQTFFFFCRIAPFPDGKRHGIIIEKFLYVTHGFGVNTFRIECRMRPVRSATASRLSSTRFEFHDNSPSLPSSPRGCAR